MAKKTEPKSLKRVKKVQTAEGWSRTNHKQGASPRVKVEKNKAA